MGTARTLTTAAVTAAALALAGCSDLPGVDWDQLSEQVQQGVDDARESVDQIERTIGDAGLDDQTRTAIEEATTSASQAIEQARTAIQQAADDAGPQGQEAVDAARAALQDAKVKVDDAASRAKGSVREGLTALADQIDRLADELDKA